MDSYGKEKFRALRVMDYLQPRKIILGRANFDADFCNAYDNMKIRSNRNATAKAIAKVMVDCTTVLANLGYEADDRMRVYGENYEENKAKGWYNDKP
jgi:hypothetical protein